MRAWTAVALAIAALAVSPAARAQERAKEARDSLERWTPSTELADRARSAIHDLLADVKDGPEGIPAESLDRIAKRVPTAELVSLVDQPFDAAHAREGQAAAALVKRSPAASRPYLARALAPETALAPSVALLDAVRSVGDEKAVLEKPLAARTMRALRDGEDAAELLVTLGAIGSRTVFPGLVDALLDQSLGANLPKVGAAAARILAREKDTDPLLQKLITRLPSLEGDRLKEAVGLLGASKGAAVPKLSEVLRRLDRDTDAGKKAGADVDPSFALCLASLVTIGTRQAFDAIVSMTRASPCAAHRARAIRTFAQAPLASQLDAASALVDILGDSTIAEHDLAGQVLVDVTGDVRSDANGWRDLIAERRARGTTKKAD